ncbi:hypothetical protein ACR75N_04660 [Parabacteroides merdae]|uniref:hypothetical protein n=1 Tax=Parabacteroides merdae TaxID=46503 RepID=UPI003DA2E0EF
MKYIILFSIIILLSSCSKDFVNEEPKDHISEPTNPVDTTSLEYFYDKYCYGYKVKDTTDLIVMGISQKRPNTDIDIKEGTTYLSGTRSGKLWIAGFEIESKEQNFEFVDSKPMDLKYKLNLGYGEYIDVTINRTNVECIIDNSPNIISRVKVYNESGGSNNSNAAYVTFKTPYSSKTYLTQSNYNEPIEWYNNTYIFYGLNINNPYDSNIYSCIDQKGDTVFTHTNDRFFYPGKVFPITNKEAIFFESKNIEGEPAISISRVNIDLPYTNSIWEILTPITYWLDDAKYSIKKEVISETIWLFTIDLLWYNGEKGNYSYKININTGELINK